MSEITEDQKMMWKRFFDDYDKDRNGHLDREEIKDAMRCCYQNPTDAEVDELMSKADKNSDSKVYFDEFCSFMQQMSDPESSMRDALHFFEEEGGTISRAKLHKILCGDEQGRTIYGILNAADVNKDGHIDKEEFIRIIQCR